MTNTYSTLDKVRNMLSLASADTADDSQILSFLNNAARTIDRYTRRHFFPKEEIRYYDHQYDKKIILDADLVQLKGLSSLNGACGFALTVVNPAAGWNWNITPYDHIIVNASTGSTLNYSGTPERADHVSGIWCYHEDWNNAWLDTGASLLNPLGNAASTRIIELNGASVGAGTSDILNQYPRISIGDILKVGEEQFHVLGTGGADASLVMLRGANGTTVATHASAASIAKFVPHPDIEYATRRLAAWSYKAQELPPPTRMAFPAIGAVEIPTAWPEEVKAIVDRYRRQKIRTI